MINTWIFYRSTCKIMTEIHPCHPGLQQTKKVFLCTGISLCRGKKGTFSGTEHCAPSEPAQQPLLSPHHPPVWTEEKSLELNAFLLCCCQRPAISPESFLSASWPPWFTPGAQQDCSEYLKYLLDRCVTSAVILEPGDDGIPKPQCDV